MPLLKLLDMNILPPTFASPESCRKHIEVISDVSVFMHQHKWQGQAQVPVQITVFLGNGGVSLHGSAAGQ